MMCKSLILPVLIGIALMALGCVQDSPGEVIELVQPTAWVNDVKANNGTSIFAGDIIRTDARGRIWYSISPKLKQCDSLPNSSLVVYPTQETVIRLDSGKIYCTTERGGPSIELRAGETRALVNDPVFSLIVEEDQTTVKVASGFAEVQSLVTGSGEVIRVEAGQQTTVFRGMDPLPPEPITIAQNEDEIFQRLEGLSEDEPLTLTPSVGPARSFIPFGCNNRRSCALHSQVVLEETRIPTIRYYRYITLITQSSLDLADKEPLKPGQEPLLRSKRQEALTGGFRKDLSKLSELIDTIVSVVGSRVSLPAELLQGK